MSTFDIGGTDSTNTFTIGGNSSNKHGLSANEFNSKLRDAAKKGEKVDFTLLGQVTDTERKKIDPKALKEYVQKHKDDKAHLQETFSNSSPLFALYTKTEGFKQKDSWLSGIIGKLFAFFSNPSLETFRTISKGLVTEDGQEINPTGSNKLLDQLDRNSKLAPLSAALRAVAGLDAQAAEMKDEIEKNPELAAEYPKETIDAYTAESLENLRHVFDQEGNIIGSNGEVLYGPLDITKDDIKALKADDDNNLTVGVGQLKWNDFAAKTFKFYASGQPGLAVDYANTVFSIFNRKMRAGREDSSLSKDERDHFRALNREVTNVFSKQLANEFGGEGFAKAFEFAFTRGAFGSESARNAIVGDAADIETERAVADVSRDFRDVATDKNNALARQGGDLDAMVSKGNKYTILDLGKVYDKNAGVVTQELNYDGNKLTLNTAADAYNRSAEILARKTAEKMATEVLDVELGDTKKRDKFLSNSEKGAGGTKSDSKGLDDDAANIADIAKNKSKKAKDVFNEMQKSVEKIKADGFMVPTADDLEASDAIAKKLTDRLIRIANIDTQGKKARKNISNLQDVISTQAQAGDFKLDNILDELVKLADGDKKNEDRIKSRLQTEFKSESNVKSLLTEFVNQEEMVSLATVVKAETIQEVVKSNTAIKEYLLRQPENRALSVSSIDDIVDNRAKLADASPELALIFADSDQYKSDSVRAEMAMLGLMSILRANPTLLSPGSESSKKIVKKIFAKEVNNDDTKANRIASKLAKSVRKEIKVKGIEDKQGKKKDLDFSTASRLAGTSVSRAKYLAFRAPDVAYRREAIVAERLARMINAHTPNSARSEVYQSVEALGQHLEEAASKLEGANFSDIRTVVTEGLNDPTAKHIVRNMFFPGDDADSTGSNSDKLSGSSAIQLVRNAARRMQMVAPRLYEGEGSPKVSPVKEPEAPKKDTSATELASAAV